MSEARDVDVVKLDSVPNVYLVTDASDQTNLFVAHN
jgi:hypothetical protein